MCRTARSETMRIHGGNSRLVRGDGGRARRRGRRSALPVRAVERGHDVVTVHAGGRSYTGAQLVLAVPPPPLRDIRFTPRLPGRRRRDGARASSSAGDEGDDAVRRAVLAGRRRFRASS